MNGSGSRVLFCLVDGDIIDLKRLADTPYACPSPILIVNSRQRDTSFAVN
jgi:hypothetical protein